MYKMKIEEIINPPRTHEENLDIVVENMDEKEKHTIVRNQIKSALWFIRNHIGDAENLTFTKKPIGCGRNAEDERLTIEIFLNIYETRYKPEMERWGIDSSSWDEIVEKIKRNYLQKYGKVKSIYHGNRQEELMRVLS